MKAKLLRTIDIIISSLLFLNSLILLIRFNTLAIGQILFNVVLSLLLFTMSFTKRPADAIQSQSLSLFYVTRLYILILLLFLILIFIYDFFDSLKGF